MMHLHLRCGNLIQIFSQQFLHKFLLAMLTAVTSLFIISFIGYLYAEESSQVTISAWQFCEGCKITVDAYSRLATNELQRLETLPKTEKRFLDAMMITDFMCDDDYFKGFKEFAKYSCIKILEDSRTHFLEEFTGSTTIAALSSKKSVFDKKKKVTCCAAGCFFFLVSKLWCRFRSAWTMQVRARRPLLTILPSLDQRSKK